MKRTAIELKAERRMKELARPPQPPSGPSPIDIWFKRHFPEMMPILLIVAIIVVVGLLVNMSHPGLHRERVRKDVVKLREEERVLQLRWHLVAHDKAKQEAVGKELRAKEKRRRWAEEALERLDAEAQGRVIPYKAPQPDFWDD